MQYILMYAEEGNITHLHIYNVKHYQRNYNERNSEMFDLDVTHVMCINSRQKSKHGMSRMLCASIPTKKVSMGCHACYVHQFPPKK